MYQKRDTKSENLRTIFAKRIEINHNIKFWYWIVNKNSRLCVKHFDFNNPFSYQQDSILFFG